MAFPRDKDDLLTDLYLGPSLGWADISGDVRIGEAGGGVRITRGKSAEGSQIDPGRATLALDNSTGKYSPRNPLSPYYGLLGRNTPIRIGVRLFVEDFARVLSSTWGTSAAGGTWGAFGAGGSVFVGDWTVDGTSGQHWVLTTASYRASYYQGLTLADAEVRVTCDMAISDVLGGPIEPANLLFRVQDNTTYYMCRVEVSTAEAVTVQIFHSTGGLIAGPVTVPGLTFAGQPLAVAAFCVGDRLGLKVWDPAASGEPRDWQVTATDRQLTAPGWVGVRSGVGSGNSNTKPVEFRYDNFTIIIPRAQMEVPSWPVKATVSGRNRWVDIEAAGITRRLRQGTPPRLSPLRRTIEASAPLAYWPGEDGRLSGGMGSAIPGHPAMTVTGPAEFVSVEGLDTYQYTVPFGTAALIDLKQGAALSAGVPGDVTTATTTKWTIHLAGDIDPAELPGDMVIMEWTTLGGTYTTWRIVMTASNTQVIAVTPGGSQSIVLTGGLLLGLASWAVSAEQVGGNVEVSFSANEVSTALFGGTLGGITRIAVNPTRVTPTGQTPVGHLAVWATASVPYDAGFTVTDTYGVARYTAVNSYGNEAATERLKRLCAEAGIPLSIPAVDVADVVRMGFQPVGALADLIQQCVDADGGVLMESRDQLGLRYRPRGSLYNQPAVEVPYGRLPQLDPVDDDQAVRNDITVSRTSGSSARAALESGPLSTLDPPDGVGTYSSSTELSLWTDRQLRDQAYWRLWLGTVDEARYPRIPIKLASPAWTGDLSGLAAVAALDSADLARLTGLPSWLPSSEADALVQGYTEVLDVARWDLTLNAQPGSPWQVATAADPSAPSVDDQRVASDDSTLTTAASPSDTTLVLSSSLREGPWTQDPADFPLDLAIGGERMTVSAIVPALSDTFARSLAGTWGSADTGQAWTTTGGSASDYSTTGSVGRQTHTATNVLHHSLIDAGCPNVELVADVTIAIGTASTAAVTSWVIARAADTANHYIARLDLGPGTGMSLILTKRVAGALSATLASASVGTHTMGATWRIRFSAVGSTLQAKAWLTSGTEPGWQVTITDTSLTTGNLVGVLSRFESGNTNTLPQSIDWDNFTVTNPQRATVTRAVNGVVKSHVAGTRVDVWDPAIVSL